MRWGYWLLLFAAMIAFVIIGVVINLHPLFIAMAVILGVGNAIYYMVKLRKVRPSKDEGSRPDS